MFFDWKKSRPWAENVSVVMQIGLTMVGCVIFCLLVGRYLDKWLGTKGIFTVVFILLGVAGGGVTAYRQILEIIQPEDRKNGEDDGSR